MLNKKYYDGIQVHRIITEELTDHETIMHILKRFADEPSAEPERKTGRWVLDEEFIDCSVCRNEKWSRTPYENLVKRFRYCPNCGADMRGGKNDG